MGTLELCYLADHPELVPTIAGWHHRQFGYLSQATPLEERVARLQAHVDPHPIPTTLVAYLGGDPVGCASLVVNDMADRPELTPWLASIYVLPEHRRHGIGAALVQRVVQEAASLDYPEIYLYTVDRAPFYARLGWSEVEQRPYRGYEVTIMRFDLT